jgi:hypothetical protein
MEGKISPADQSLQGLNRRKRSFHQFIACILPKRNNYHYNTENYKRNTSPPVHRLIIYINLSNKTIYQDQDADYGEEKSDHKTQVD